MAFFFSFESVTEKYIKFLVMAALVFKQNDNTIKYY